LIDCLNVCLAIGEASNEGRTMEMFDRRIETDIRQVSALNSSVGDRH